MLKVFKVKIALLSVAFFLSTSTTRLAVAKKGFKSHTFRAGKKTGGEIEKGLEDLYKEYDEYINTLSEKKEQSEDENSALKAKPNLNQNYYEERSVLEKKRVALQQNRPRVFLRKTPEERYEDSRSELLKELKKHPKEVKEMKSIANRIRKMELKNPRSESSRARIDKQIEKLKSAYVSKINEIGKKNPKIITMYAKTYKAKKVLKG